MPMPTLNPVAEDKIVPRSEDHRRPTIVPPPMTASPELSARAAPPQLHGTGEAPHPGRNRPSGADGRDRSGAAPGGDLLVPAHRLAPSAGGGRLQRPVAVAARSQAGGHQPVGGRTDGRTGRERAAAATPRAGRSHHRSPKKSCGPAWDSASADRRRAVMEALAVTAPPRGSLRAICDALGVSRASLYRRRAAPSRPPGRDRNPHGR